MSSLVDHPRLVMTKTGFWADVLTMHENKERLKPVPVPTHTLALGLRHECFPLWR